MLSQFLYNKYRPNRGIAISGSVSISIQTQSWLFCIPRTCPTLPASEWDQGKSPLPRWNTGWLGVGQAAVPGPHLEGFETRIRFG